MFDGVARRAVDSRQQTADSKRQTGWTGVSSKETPCLAVVEMRWSSEDLAGLGYQDAARSSFCRAIETGEGAISSLLASKQHSRDVLIHGGYCWSGAGAVSGVAEGWSQAE